MGETVERVWGGEAPEEPVAARRRVPLAWAAVGWRQWPRTGHYETDSDEWADLPAETADEWDSSCWQRVDPMRGR
jgi:hypothetical protein